MSWSKSRLEWVQKSVCLEKIQDLSIHYLFHGPCDAWCEWDGSVAARLLSYAQHCFGLTQQPPKVPICLFVGDPSRAPCFVTYASWVELSSHLHELVHICPNFDSEFAMLKKKTIDVWTLSGASKRALNWVLRALFSFFLSKLTWTAKQTCTKGHVVEKATGVAHIEMNNPACCTAAQKSSLNLQDILYLIICTLFCSFICLARPCSTFAYGVSCLASSLKMRHGERGFNSAQMPTTTSWSRDPSAAHGLECHMLSRTWALRMDCYRSS